MADSAPNDPQPAPATVADVIDLLAKKKLLGEVGITGSHARTIKARANIPGHWHERIVTVATQHALPITYPLLARLAAARKNGASA